MSTVMIDPRVVTRGVAGKVSGAYSGTTWVFVDMPGEEPTSEQYDSSSQAVCIYVGVDLELPNDNMGGRQTDEGKGVAHVVLSVPDVLQRADAWKIEEMLAILYKAIHDEPVLIPVDSNGNSTSHQIEFCGLRSSIVPADQDEGSRGQVRKVEIAFRVERIAATVLETPTGS